MKILKTKIVISFFALHMLFSCSEDFLNVVPEDTATVDAFYNTENDFERAVIGLYANWRTAAARPPMYTEFRSDNLLGFRDVEIELSANDVSANTGDSWWALYPSLVAPSNLILDRIEGLDASSEEVKNRLTGEALFMRGYAYYWLNIMFGGVPLVTSEITASESFTIPRSSEAETWLQVEEDLRRAYELLPDAASEAGRTDKYVAAGFLARVLLQQQKWSEASTVLQDAYNNSGHSLALNWTDMWTTEAEKTSSEYMMLSIANSQVSHNDYAQQFLSVEGNPITQAELTIDYKPGLETSFEEGDIRKDETIGRRGGASNFVDNRKYDFGWDGAFWTFDLVALRFADIVLMYAEAISMEAGSPQQQSLDLINMTRNRAGLDDLQLSDVPSLDAFVEALLAERRAEFVFEGTRFADLKRHGKLLEKLAAIGPEYVFDDTYLVLPIPQFEIDKSRGVLVQNDGY